MQSGVGLFASVVNRMKRPSTRATTRTKRPNPPCPKCKGTFVRRILPRKGIEQILWRLFVYPFRCQLCLHRYIALQLFRRYKIELGDMREYERLHVQLPASFSGDQCEGSGTTKDVSMKGCWIDSEQRVRKGTLLRVALTGPDGRTRVEAKMAAVRWSLGRGFGVEFITMEPEHREGLESIVRSCWERKVREEAEKDAVDSPKPTKTVKVSPPRVTRVVPRPKEKAS